VTQSARRPSDEQQVLQRLAACIHLVRAECQPRAYALLLGERLTVALSDGLDQVGLEDLARLRADLPPAVRQGTAFRGAGQRPYLLLPCNGRGGLVGLLYIELAPLSRVPSRTPLFVDMLSRAASLDDAGPVGLPALTLAEDPAPLEGLSEAATNLIFLLERNEWNVSRVARILGVTRMTIYNRLRRAQVSRVHIPKLRRRVRRARPPERKSA
jgi:hypothetical protein